MTGRKVSQSLTPTPMPTGGNIAQIGEGMRGAIFTLILKYGPKIEDLGEDVIPAVSREGRN